MTCCPYRGDITLGCVTPSTLSNVWETLFCTWIAPESGTTVSITHSDDEGTTSTSAVSMQSPGGINALGIRMVYQSSDLAAASGTGPITSGAATATSGGATNAGTAGDTDQGSSSGLSTGAIIAIAVVISVVLIAGAAGLFLLIRKRKQAEKGAAAGRCDGGNVV